MNMNNSFSREIINVELVYPLPHEQKILSLQVNCPCTIGEAIEMSGILTIYPEIDLNLVKVGIFSKVATLTQLLRDKDRIEIYRPLIADPKEVRRKKAALQKES